MVPRLVAYQTYLECLVYVATRRGERTTLVLWPLIIGQRSHASCVCNRENTPRDAIPERTDELSGRITSCNISATCPKGVKTATLPCYEIRPQHFLNSGRLPQHLRSRRIRAEGLIASSKSRGEFTCQERCFGGSCNVLPCARRSCRTVPAVIWGKSKSTSGERRRTSIHFRRTARSLHGHPPRDPAW